MRHPRAVILSLSKDVGGHQQSKWEPVDELQDPPAIGDLEIRRYIQLRLLGHVRLRTARTAARDLAQALLHCFRRYFDSVG